MARCSSFTVFDARFARLSGTHRVQRVPDNEKSGRRHSSTIAVVWLGDTEPEMPGMDHADVREEFIRTTGKGGQRRNKVETAVRLTHVPTGIQVVADGQRQQSQNRMDAWARLSERLVRHHAELTASVSNADRAAQIDTERAWTWTQWRDEVRGPHGRMSMRHALSGKLGRLVC